MEKPGVLQVKCLINNKVCGEFNKKCKTCKLDCSDNTVEILKQYKDKKIRNKIKEIIKELPKECKNCNFIKILDINKKKVYCPYRINKCIIKR